MNEKLNPSEARTEQSSMADHQKVVDDRMSGKFGVRDHDPTPTPYAWLVLFLMVMNSMFNQWQRYNISYTNAYKGNTGDFRAGDPKYSINAEYS